MANEVREEIELVITGRDNASDVLDKVANKTKKVESSTKGAAVGVEQATKNVAANWRNSMAVLSQTSDLAGGRLGQLGGMLGKTAGQYEGLAGAAGASGAAAAAGVAAVVAAYGMGLREFIAYSEQVRNVQRLMGSSAEDASRVVAVADDLEIQAGTTAAAMRVMTRVIGTNSEALTKYGVSIDHSSASGQRMINNLANVADAYNNTADPAKKAAIAAAAFGRSYSEMIPLLQQGGAGIKQAMADVNGNELMSQKDLDDAKKYKKAMDDFGDALKALGRELGRDIIPALSTLIKVGAKVVEVFGWIKSKIDDLPGPLKAMVDPISSLGDMFSWFSDEANQGLQEAGDAAKQWAEDQAQASADAQAALEEWNNALQSSTSGVFAFVNAQRSVQSSQTATSTALERQNDAFHKYIDLAAHTPAAMAGITSAQRGLTNARRDEARAAQAVVDAQQELNRLRQGEARTIEEAQMRVREAQRAKYEAEKRAADDIAGIGVDPNSDPTQARLDSADATDAATRASWELQDAEAQLAKLQNGGIEATDEYKDAVSRLHDAQQAQADSAQARIDAETKVRDAVVQYGKDMETAWGDMQKAAEDVTTARLNEATAVIGLDGQYQTLRDELAKHPELYQAILDKIDLIEKRAPGAAAALEALIKPALGTADNSVNPGHGSVVSAPVTTADYFRAIGTNQGNAIALGAQFVFENGGKDSAHRIDIIMDKTRANAEAHGFTHAQALELAAMIAQLILSQQKMGSKTFVSTEVPGSSVGSAGVYA